MLIVIALAVVISAFMGGLLALKFKDHLHIVLGFSAGAVLGVAFFDLLPESIEAGAKAGIPTLTIVAGAFFFYLLLDRLLFFHCHDDGHCGAGNHRGRVGAGNLSLHSFLDGAAVGVAFHASPAIGAVVALAVLAHGFSDGINTVGVILRHGGNRREAFKWLMLDAAAPALGILSTYFLPISETAIAPLLAIFAGFFLYLGASDLLPESHHGHPKGWTTAATILGAIVVYLAVSLIGV